MNIYEALNLIAFAAESKINDSDNIENAEDFLEVRFATQKITMGLPLFGNDARTVNFVPPARKAKAEYNAERLDHETYKIEAQANVDGITGNFRFAAIVPTKDRHLIKSCIESQIKERIERYFKQVINTGWDIRGKIARSVTAKTPNHGKSWDEKQSSIDTYNKSWAEEHEHA